MTNYKAPWSAPLVVMSAFVSLLCVGGAIAMLLSGRAIRLWIALIPLVIVFGGALFTIRGYTVTADAILIHRLFWMTRLPLAGLQSAQFDPNAMRCSIRLLGNGGLFSFAGFFRNKPLGIYRAFVTDPRQAVVLRFPARTVVVSPSDPERFVHQIAPNNGTTKNAEGSN